MRKLLLTVALASAVAFANAQTMTSKNGTPILPEAGEWSLGFDAVPVLNYFGNVLNGNTYNSVQMSYQDPITIVGKYMTDENTAYRGKLRIGFGSNKTKNSVTDDLSTANPPAEVLDERTISGMNITLGAGIQKFRGKGRLKGFYGAEAAIMLGSGKTTNKYANAFSATNNSPTSTDFTQPVTGGGFVSGPASSRVTEDKSGSTFGVTLRGFAGVEYFFAPKMSVSAEYGWGLGLTSTGDGETTTEYWDGSTAPGAVKTNSSKSGGASSFGIDVDNASGSIVLSFYF